MSTIRRISVIHEKVINTIVKNFQQILDESGIDAVITNETVLSRDMGIDSLGIVNLIFGIEEDLEIELDDYLAEIRNAHTVRELSEIAEKAYNIGTKND